MKCEDDLGELTEDEIASIKTTKYQKHVQNSYGFKFCCIEKKYDEDVQYFNSPNPDDVCKNFIQTLESYAKKAYSITQKYKSKIFLKTTKKLII